MRQQRTRGGIPIVFWLAVALIVPAMPLLAAGQELDAASARAIQTVVEQVENAVVQIETRGGRNANSAMAGNTQPVSGTVVDDNGHVVAAAASFSHDPVAITVRDSGGSSHPAKVIARNDARQVVLLQVEDSGSSGSWTFVAAADYEKCAVGQTAIALGKVYDAGAANVSVGIISALGRIDGRTIQTDARVSFNNYGGPLVNLNGRVWGILVPRAPEGSAAGTDLSWYDSGVGFAVPLGEMRLQEMMSGQSFRAGRLGARFDSADGIAARAVVRDIVAGSAAAQGGLTAGDTVTAIDGKPIEWLVQLQNALASRYAGDQIELTVDRQGQPISMVIELGGE
jgi:serine protease Do